MNQKTKASAPLDILVLDIGGTHVKVWATGQRQSLKFVSGPDLGPAKMVATVLAATPGWKYDAVSIGYPGPVVHGRPLAEPCHLGPGWVGFDFQKTFGRPVKMVNDAALQALGSYQGGRMLFLGLGTGLGSACIANDVLEPMELAHLPYRKGRSYEEYVGLVGLERLGKKRWRHHVRKVIQQLRNAVQADYVVIGGGNAKLIGKLPPCTRLGANANAFKGGDRLWQKMYNGPAQNRFNHDSHRNPPAF